MKMEQKVSTTYTPTIVGVTPTATPATTEDVQGKTQESTVSFEAGKTTVDGVEKSVEIDPATYTLLGEDGQPAKEVPAKDPEGNVIGKYTLKTVDGKLLLSSNQQIKHTQEKYNQYAFKLKIRMEQL